MIMRWIATLLLSLWFAWPTSAASVEARLVRASNELGCSDAALADLYGKLKEKFGYQYYQQLGARRAPLKPGEKVSLDLGERFRVYVTPQSVGKRQQRLELEWFSGKTLLVRSVVEIVENGHLLVKGPEVGNDWIVLVVSVRR
jgi:alkylhydroperoxidase family enzyme